MSGSLAGALTITATAAGLTSDSTAFSVVHGTATTIDLLASGSSASGATKTLTATIQDAAGNTVTSDSSTVVGFAKTGGPGTVVGLGTDTAASGVASIDVTNTTAGQIDVAASAAGLTAGTTTLDDRRRQRVDSPRARSTPLRARSSPTASPPARSPCSSRTRPGTTSQQAAASWL